MSSSKALNYAIPLFEVCKENNITHEMLYELKEIVKVHDKEILKVLNYPIISREQKKELMDELLSLGYRNESINLLKLLVDFNDVRLFKKIKGEYSKLYQKEYDVKIVTVVLAKEPSDQVRDQIIKLLEQKLEAYVVIHIDIDPEIVSGIIIKYDGYVMDNSIKKHLLDLVKSI